MESPTIIPMILADMFCALTKCINGEMYFEGCNILLILACEEKLSVITFDEIVWNYYWFPAKDLARVQEATPNDDMSRFVFETPPDFAFNSEDILKILFGSIISELTEMVVEQDKGKMVYGYLSWFRDPVTFGDTPEGSSRKRKDQHTIRQLKKELEKANATIAR
ncbi:hypothetical protein KY285_037955 [Solanum tuberosum]|nr:hypothetical protein KY285_037955 [Solanum tuberosum]